MEWRASDRLNADVRDGPPPESILTGPLDLPDFVQPPLNEVVLGVQFDPPAGYQQIRAGEVWALFKKDFPKVNELPALPPSFETFGPTHGMPIHFGMLTGSPHNRFWFMSENENEIVQFQNDRLLHNWRKRGVENQTYPRFEKIIRNFESELELFYNYIQCLHPQNLIIRQCEISYINIIEYDPKATTPSDWLSYVNFPAAQPDDFVFTFRRTIFSRDNRPRGRLICETGMSSSPEGGSAIRLTLIVRGLPETPDIKSALEFFSQGREMIVRTFAEITTDSAHQIWKRTQ